MVSIHGRVGLDKIQCNQEKRPLLQPILQPPNPTGAITYENQFGSQVGLTLTTAGPEYVAEHFRSFNFGEWLQSK